MKVIELAKNISKRIQWYKVRHRSIGFVPTMGALHEGHFSLIRRSIAENEITVCSIFVNPTQFNSTSDLDNYPQTLSSDCRNLQKLGCDVVFAPSVEEVYPEGQENKIDIDLKSLDRRMEGMHRPGHFGGVVQVLKRLMDLVQCDTIYLGQKDYQQYRIVDYMIKYFHLPVKTVVCPIVRESNGLAMSSRNRRLSEGSRKKAGVICEALKLSQSLLHQESIDYIRKKVLEFLTIPGFQPEYFVIINGETLDEIETIENVSEVIACTAVWVDDVRLIDNMRLIPSASRTKP